MNTPKTIERKPADIPEVAEYLETQQKLQDYKETFHDVFEAYDALVQEHNDALQRAEKVVRAHKVTCGPFVLYQYQTKIDAQKLFDAVGRDQFLKVGGSIKTVPEYDIDKKMFEAQVAQNKLPMTVLQEVVVISPRYKCPDPITG